MAADPLIVNVCLTGMIPTKAMTPHLPVTKEEVLHDVDASRQLGASIFHVHARTPDGKPTSQASAYAPIIEGIRDIDEDLVVCVTCSGRQAPTLEERAEVLDLSGKAKPDMASLTLGSNNFATEPSVNSPDVIRGLANRMLERGIKPELEVFEPGMVSFGRYLVRKGILQEPCYANILLGNLGTSPATPLSLASFLGEIPSKWIWATAGLGRYQLTANTFGIAAGGHVRVGLEDNIWWDSDRTQLATNPMLVDRIARIAAHLERPLASPKETRSMLGIEHSRLEARN